MSTEAPQQMVQQVVLRDLPIGTVTTADVSVDLRDGLWTRLGADNVRGDQATEGTLRMLAERSRDAARAQGFTAGWAEGLRASAGRLDQAREEQNRVVAERSAHLLLGQHSAMTALEAACRRAEESGRETAERLRAGAVELALELAEAILGRELATCDDLGADALHRALSGIPLDTAVTVRLHPADLDAIDPTVTDGRPVTLVADPGVQPGDAVAETASGVVDASIAAALSRVREVLVG